MQMYNIFWAHFMYDFVKIDFCYFLILFCPEPCYITALTPIRGSLKGRKSVFGEPHYSVDTFLIGKTLFIASKTDPAACSYAAWKNTSTKNEVRGDLKRLWRHWSLLAYHKFNYRLLSFNMEVNDVSLYVSFTFILNERSL